MRLCQNLLQGLGVRLHAGHHCSHRTEPDVHEPLRRGADQQNMAFELFPRRFSRQHLPCRNEPIRDGFCIVHPDFSPGRGGNRKGADPDFLNAGALFRQCPDDIIVRALNHPQGFRGKGREGLLLNFNDQGHPAYNAVRIRDKVHGAVSRSRFFQRGDRRYRAGKGIQMGQRGFSGKNKAKRPCRAMIPGKALFGGKA